MEKDCAKYHSNIFKNGEVMPTKVYVSNAVRYLVETIKNDKNAGNTANETNKFIYNTTRLLMT